MAQTKVFSYYVHEWCTPKGLHLLLIVTFSLTFLKRLHLTTFWATCQGYWCQFQKVFFTENVKNHWHKNVSWYATEISTIQRLPFSSTAVTFDMGILHMKIKMYQFDTNRLMFFRRTGSFIFYTPDICTLKRC